MHDLEDTVLSLRRTLGDREREIELMKTSGQTSNGDSKEARPVLSLSDVSTTTTYYVIFCSFK